MRFEPATRYDLQLSIIIPVKDEEQNVAALAEEISNVLYTLSTFWECIWIDDGSTDTTLDEFAKINRKDTCHQFISLARHYGHSAALAVGFTSARGQILMTMDGDGQNNPKDIIPLLMKYLSDENICLVGGIRKKRMDSLLKRYSSIIANNIRKYILNDYQIYLI